MGNNKKSHMVSEKLAREYNKVNMQAYHEMGMPNTDKKRKQGKGCTKNNFM